MERISPDDLKRIVPRQEGRPRVIHPIGASPLAVGSVAAAIEQEQETMSDAYVTIEKDEVRLSEDKKESVQFRKGDRVHRAVAAKFGLADAPEAAYARSLDEQPDVAPTEPQVSGKRAKGSAPENRSK